MIRRRACHEVQEALGRQSAVALIGPRQVGNTTQVHAIGEGTDALYLDLESCADSDKLTDARSDHALPQHVVILRAALYRR